MLDGLVGDAHLREPSDAAASRFTFKAQQAEASNESLDVPSTAAELRITESVLRQQMEQIEDLGLALSGLEEGLHPILLNTGRQYLALAGEVEVAVLSFLPSVIDDLHARQALLHAGTVLVDEFRAALVTSAGVDYAREIVPPAFVPAVDERLALDLFAAAVALTARLSAGRPAGCVAEEILAVALIEEAHAWLEMKHDSHDLDRATMDTAAAELRGLFELFQDDDVLDMFDIIAIACRIGAVSENSIVSMSPGDAATGKPARSS